MARVELHQATKIYPGGVRAVNAIDLSVSDREFVVLIGPSGCGKSTTLRMIAGLEDISSGDIRIGERVVNDVAPKDRDIAMVFQNYALYPHMTVYKNMAFGLKLRRFPRAEIEKRVMEAARTLDITHLLDRKPKALSGGQRQRVAVGRAIVREPAAFLFDEPLSNLDAKLRVTTRAELKRLHQRLRTTTIYVTHDQEEAMTLGDRIVVMRDGIIHQADAPLRTYNDPVNRFVAGFIGMPPMNFFEGAIKTVDGQRVFEEGVIDADGQLTLPGNGFRVVVPQHVRERLEGSVGAHLVFGIRPEHLYVSPPPGAVTVPIDFRLNVIEPLGSSMDVYMSTVLTEQVIARIEAHSGLAIDTRATMHVDLRKILCFEPGVTGANLLRPVTLAASEPAHAQA